MTADYRKKTPRHLRAENKMDFVFISNPWEAGENNPTSKHHIAAELVRAGHRVLWVNATGMRVPDIGKRHDRKRILDKLIHGFSGRRNVSDSIWTISPLVIPAPGSNIAQWVNSRIYYSSITNEAKKLGMADPVLVSFLPIVPRLLRRWRGTSVYYCVDRWDRFEMYDSEVMTRLNRESAEAADLVITSSRELFKREKEYNANTHFISHGVQFAHFAASLDDSHKKPQKVTRKNEILSLACPAIASRRRRKGCPELVEGRGGSSTPTLQHSNTPSSIVGFFGLLSEWVDQELLVRLAREVQDCRIVLLGPSDVDVSRLRNEPGIEVLGPVPFETLPDKIAQFDVGIIPFVVNELTESVNPIKLKEMMAAGCPVVSTALPEVEEIIKEPTPPCGHPSGGGDLSESTNLSSQRLDHRINELSNFVSVAQNHDEFIQMVKYRLENPLSHDQKKALSESVKQETWEAKVKEFLEYLPSD